MNSNLISMLRNMADDIGNIGASPFTVDLQLLQLAIAALEAQWQPIESAPKDGTEIIGFSPEVGKPLLIRWIAPQDFMTTDECERYMDGVEEADADDAEAWLENPDWACADFRSGDFLADDCQPTHWQPLPAPPEVVG